MQKKIVFTRTLTQTFVRSALKDTNLISTKLIVLESFPIAMNTSPLLNVKNVMMATSKALLLANLSIKSTVFL